MSAALPPPVVLAERRAARGRLRALATATSARPARSTTARAADHTREAISAASRAGGLHGWAESLVVDGCRVGHLLLDGTGVLVVQSTWTDRRLTRNDLIGIAERASTTARTTADVVRGLGCAAAVRPVAVVWGATQTGVPAGGTRVRDALVVRGGDLEPYLCWSHRADDALGAADAVDLLRALQAVPADDRVVSHLR